MRLRTRRPSVANRVSSEGEVEQKKQQARHSRRGGGGGGARGPWLTQYLSVRAGRKIFLLCSWPY